MKSGARTHRCRLFTGAGGGELGEPKTTGQSWARRRQRVAGAGAQRTRALVRTRPTDGHAYAVRSKLVAENVAQAVPNPEPKRREAPTFGCWEELERLAAELPPERRSLPILVAGTGLRPGGMAGARTARR